MDADLHPVRIYRGDGEVDQLADAQARGVDRAEDGFVFEVFDTGQNSLDFFFAAYGGQGLLLHRTIHKIQFSSSTQYFLKIKFNGIDSLVLIGGGDSALSHQKPRKFHHVAVVETVQVFFGEVVDEFFKHP